MYSAQVLGNKMASAWTESFNFCRRTDGDFHSPEALKEQPMAIPTLPPRAAPAGQLRGAVAAPLELPPSHHSYFSTAPLAAFNFTLAHTSGVEYNMSGVWQSSHEYSDGRCAILRWVQVPGYQIHFVDQFSKYQGEGTPLHDERARGEHGSAAADSGGSGSVASASMSTAQVEQYLGALHGNMSAVDAYMDFRVGWVVDDLSPFAASLDAAGSAYLPLDTAGKPVAAGGVGGAASLLVQLPGGIIFELAKAS
jgi:hypothetical protein